MLILFLPFLYHISFPWLLDTASLPIPDPYMWYQNDRQVEPLYDRSGNERPAVQRAEGDTEASMYA